MECPLRLKVERWVTSLFCSVPLVVVGQGLDSRFAASFLLLMHSFDLYFEYFQVLLC